MTRRVLITGATGFIGKWTVRYWRSNHPNDEVWSTSFHDKDGDLYGKRFRQLDLCDSENTMTLIAEINPSHIIHLGGLVGSDSLQHNFRINVLATENLFEALLRTSIYKAAKVLQISSAAVYGIIKPDSNPISEDSILNPVTPYAISKLAQEMIALRYYYIHGIDVRIGRIFNIIGPGQPKDLVPMTFMHQIANMHNKHSKLLKVGNVNPTRDFIDIRDIAGAFHSIFSRGKPGETYNIASGLEISIDSLIRKIIALSDEDIKMEPSVGRSRMADVPRIYASINKIKSNTGWVPKLNLEQSLKDTWDSLREK